VPGEPGGPPAHDEVSDLEVGWAALEVVEPEDEEPVAEEELTAVADAVGEEEQAEAEAQREPAAEPVESEPHAEAAEPEPEPAPDEQPRRRWFRRTAAEVEAEPEPETPEVAEPPSHVRVPAAAALALAAPAGSATVPFSKARALAAKRLFSYVWSLSYVTDYELTTCTRERDGGVVCGYRIAFYASPACSGTIAVGYKG